MAKKRILHNLKLSTIAAVDYPCQEGARAAIIKRRPDAPATPSLLAVAIAKYVSSDDGAHTFDEVLQENRFSEAIWPMTSALQQAITSIVGDRKLSGSERESKITASVDEFLGAVRDIDPQAEKRLSELITKRNDTMNWEQIAKEAQAQVTKLTGELATAQAAVTTEKARADAAEASVSTEKAAHEATKKTLTEATDEVISVEGEEVRKSVVGDGQFRVVKLLQSQAATATFKSRAQAEISHLPGTLDEKAAVLKAIDAQPEEVKKTLTTIVTAAEKMLAGGFEMIGVGDDGKPVSTAKARGDFIAKVAEIKKRDECPEHVAMQTARAEHPDLFKAYREAANDRANAG